MELPLQWTLNSRGCQVNLLEICDSRLSNAAIVSAWVWRECRNKVNGGGRSRDTHRNILRISCRCSCLGKPEHHLLSGGEKTSVQWRREQGDCEGVRSNFHNFGCSKCRFWAILAPMGRAGIVVEWIKTPVAGRSNKYLRIFTWFL